MQLSGWSVHFPLQCSINRPLLLHTIQSAKTFVDNLCGVVITVTRQICDRNFCVGERDTQKGLYVVRFHGHGRILVFVTTDVGDADMRRKASTKTAAAR